MKKLLSILLAFGMTISLAACSGGGTGTTSAPAAPAPQQSAAAPADNAPAEAAPAGFVPAKETELVVPSAAGGGSDLHARTTAEIALKNGFISKNFVVNNMTGGSGAIAYAYTYGKAKDDYVLTILHSGQIMSTIANKSPVTADQLVYIASVAFDNLTICVPKDSPYKDIQSLIKAATDNPDSINMGGSQRGNSDHMALELFNKYTGAKASFVAFNSNGESMSALLGGHLDAGFFNPAECIGQIEAGEIVPLVTYTAERMGGIFADVPTFTEAGYSDLVFREVRGILAPPEMSAEAIAYYEDVIRKVSETDEWQKDYIEKNYLEPIFMDSQESRAFFDEEIKTYIQIFEDVGVI